MTTQHLVPLVVLSVGCLTAAESYEHNWPQWRGPNGNGLVTHGNPPLEWNEERNIQWKVEIPGQGHATPVVWANKIFVLTAVPSGTPSQAAPAQEEAEQGRQPGRGPGGRGGSRGGSAPTQPYSFRTLCLDRTTGEVLWEKEARRAVPHQGVQSSNTYASGSPVTDGEHLYAWFGSEGLYCYDLGGKEIWQRDLGQVDVTFGEGSSPALAGDVLIVVQDNNGESFIAGFDKRTGDERWRRPRDEGSGWTTPYVLDGGRLVIVNGSNAVVAYNGQTGETLWQCSGLGSNPVPMIVSDAEAVYAMSGHRNGAGLAIRLGGSGDLTGTDAVRWRVDRGTPYVPSPLLYDGLLFFCQRNSAILTCLDAASGEAHFEQERVEGVSGLYSSPVGVQNRIYWAGQNGVTLVLERAKELKVLASNQLEDGFDASPVVVGDRLYLRGRQHLYCIAEN